MLRTLPLGDYILIYVTRPPFLFGGAVFAIGEVAALET